MPQLSTECAISSVLEKSSARLARVSGPLTEGNSRQNDERAQNQKRRRAVVKL